MFLFGPEKGSPLPDRSSALLSSCYFCLRTTISGLPFGPLLLAAATKMRRMKGEKNFAVYEIRGYHHNIIDGVPQTPLKTLV